MLGAKGLTASPQQKQVRRRNKRGPVETSESKSASDAGILGIVHLRPFSLGYQERLGLVDSGKLIPDQEEQANLNTGHSHGNTKGGKEGLQAEAGVGLGRA